MEKFDKVDNEIISKYNLFNLINKKYLRIDSLYKINIIQNSIL